MAEFDGIAALLLLALWIWAILDVIATDAALCRNLPKPMWLVFVIFIPDIGSIAWLLLGRPEKGAWRPGSTDYSTPRRSVALEDHPRYSSTPTITDRHSKELDQQLDNWEAEQASKKADLDRRETELRDRELALRERELQQREQQTDS